MSLKCTYKYKLKFLNIDLRLNASLVKLTKKSYNHILKYLKKF